MTEPNEEIMAIVEVGGIGYTILPDDFRIAKKLDEASKEDEDIEEIALMVARYRLELTAELTTQLASSCAEVERLRVVLEIIAEKDKYKYWCLGCKEAVDGEHKHWRDCKPIESIREADDYRAVVAIAREALASMPNVAEIIDMPGEAPPVVVYSKEVKDE
jgi:hypothetical protein